MFNKQKNEVELFINKFDSEKKKIEKILDDQLKVIVRYDEILCDKAQKHSLTEIKTELMSKI